MKKLIVIAFALTFALGAFADDTMNNAAPAEGAATTHMHHKKHEKKMKKKHAKKHHEAAPAANTGAPAGAQ